MKIGTRIQSLKTYEAIYLPHSGVETNHKTFRETDGFDMQFVEEDCIEIKSIPTGRYVYVFPSNVIELKLEKRYNLQPIIGQVTEKIGNKIKDELPKPPKRDKK